MLISLNASATMLTCVDRYELKEGYTDAPIAIELLDDEIRVGDAKLGLFTQGNMRYAYSMYFFIVAYQEAGHATILLEALHNNVVWLFVCKE